MNDAMTILRVERAGPSTLIQDRGRPTGPEHGVATSGAFDQRAYELANRLVGNRPGAAALEVLLGGVVLRATSSVVIAVTGAPCDVTVEARAVPHGAAVAVAAGGAVSIAVPTVGLRAYLSVRGGIDAARVLGSRSSDTLGLIGPPPVREGDALRVGAEIAGDAHFEVAPQRDTDPGAPFILHEGPHTDLLDDAARAALFGVPWAIDARADRVGVRLAPLARMALPRLPGDLPSFPVFPGCVQLPPDGQPVILGPDAGTTGGYAVIGVLSSAAIDRIAQARPGDRVQLRPERR